MHRWGLRAGDAVGEMEGSVVSTLHGGPGFRRGAATWAKQVGIPDEDIQLLGRWKSDAYKRYIEVHPEHIFGVSRRLQTPSFFPDGPPGLPLRRPQALSDSRDTPDMPGPTL